MVIIRPVVDPLCCITGNFEHLGSKMSGALTVLRFGACGNLNVFKSLTVTLG